MLNDEATSETARRLAGKREQRKRKPSPMIGWRELAAFPDLGVDRIHAKIDTGAKTSAIHAFRVHPIDIDGAPGVEFFLHPRRRRKKPEIYCRAPIVGKRVIRSSNGVEQERYVIATHMRIGGRTWKIDLTLADRDAMGYRLLIGRDAMRRRFVIDPGASYLLNEDFYAEKESR